MMLVFIADAPLAQSAEQLTLNQWVPGSSPGGRTLSHVKRSDRFQISHSRLVLRGPVSPITAFSSLSYAVGIYSGTVS